MKIQIITEKPNEIETELKESVRTFKDQFKPNLQTKILLKMAHIDMDYFKDSMFANYVKEDKNMFTYEVIFLGLDQMKPILLEKLKKAFKKIDDKIIINEI